MTVFIKYSDGNYKFVPVAHTNSRSWPPSLKLCTSPPYRPQARFYLPLQGSESQLGLIAGSVVCHLKGRIEMGDSTGRAVPGFTALFTKPPDCLPPYRTVSGGRSCRWLPFTPNGTFFSGTAEQWNSTRQSREAVGWQLCE